MAYKSNRKNDLLRPMRCSNEEARNGSQKKIVTKEYEYVV